MVFDIGADCERGGVRGLTPAVTGNFKRRAAPLKVVRVDSLVRQHGYEAKPQLCQHLDRAERLDRCNGVYGPAD
jgi:hypothetical protein